MRITKSLIGEIDSAVRRIGKRRGCMISLGQGGAHAIKWSDDNRACGSAFGNTIEEAIKNATEDLKAKLALKTKETK
jgi:hypothetical protein